MRCARAAQGRRLHALHVVPLPGRLRLIRKT
jgi:hypothetical protein